MLSPAELDVAQKTLKFKNVGSSMGFASTLWRGEVIMFYYNTIAKEIMNIFCAQLLDEDDIYQLESLIRNKIALDKSI